MQEKGPVWIIIFFLLITFILLNTVTIEQATDDLEAEMRTIKGLPAKGNVIIEERPPQTQTLEDKEIILQAISVTATDPREIELTIDIPYSWLGHLRMSEQTLTLHHGSNKSWEPITIDERYTYADQYTITTKTIRNGTYILSGIKNSDPNKARNIPPIKTQIIILIALFIALLLISNIRFGSKKKKKEHKQTKEEKLEAFIRKAIIDKMKDEDIKEQLLSAGWEEKDVDQALRRARFF